MGQRSQEKQGIIIFHMEKKSKIINWVQDFLYTTEFCQQLRERR